MAAPSKPIEVYLEAGQKRTFGAAAAQCQLASHGPREGVHWSARYFVRCVAWHALDHVWEIEDRGQADELPR